MEGQPTGCETVFTNHVSDECHVLKQKIATTTLAPELKKYKWPTSKKWAKDLISISPMKIYKIPGST